jgi:hypothetical protein
MAGVFSRHFLHLSFSRIGTKTKTVVAITATTVFVYFKIQRSNFTGASLQVGSLVPTKQPDL